MTNSRSLNERVAEIERFLGLRAADESQLPPGTPQQAQFIDDLDELEFRNAGQDPRVKRRLRVNSQNLRWAIGTVAEDVRAFSINRPAQAQVYYPQADVSNTSNETNLLDHSVFPEYDDIDGGLLDLAGGWRVRLGGTYLNNSGAARDLTMKVILGSTTMWQDTLTNVAASASERAWLIDFIIGAQGSVNSQVLNGFFLLSLANTATVGVGSDPSSVSPAVFSGTASENSAALLTPQFTVQHSIGDSNLRIRRQWGYVEYL